MLITIEELRRWFDEDTATLVTRLQEETGRYGSNEAEAWRKSLQTLTRVFRARLSAKINLIPYNTVEGLEWSRPSRARQERFQSILRQHGVIATLRREKGHDIAAACGQLRLQTKRGDQAVTKFTS